MFRLPEPSPFASGGGLVFKAHNAICKKVSLPPNQIAACATAGLVKLHVSVLSGFVKRQVCVRKAVFGRPASI